MQLQDGLRKQHYELMAKMMDDRTQLRNLMMSEQPEPKGGGEAYGRISAVQGQMLESLIAARNQTQTMLTDEQKEQLKQWRGKGRGMGRRMRRTQ